MNPSIQRAVSPGAADLDAVYAKIAWRIILCLPEMAKCLR
jgi:hypothetical protein